MDSTFYYERLALFRRLLFDAGYYLIQAQASVTGDEVAPVLIQMPGPVVGKQTIVALPDVHLGNGKGGDVFIDGDTANVRRLASTLRCIRDFVLRDSFPVTPLQLGDWYDVWRAIGGDADQARYAAIDNVSAFREILDLDKQLGLAHCIGNHDASFTKALPDRRVADGARFRFGFGLGKTRGRIYALHGHQTDRIEGEPNAAFDKVAVWLGTLAATFVSSKFRDLTELIDKRGPEGALIWIGGEAAEAAVSQLPGGIPLVKAWLTRLLAEAREDVPQGPRPPQAPPMDGRTWYAHFVAREARKRLTRIASEAVKVLYGPDANDLELLLVGHSHKACISWAPHPTTGSPVVVVDAGSWVYGQAQILFAAGNTLGVYDIVPVGSPAPSS